MLIVLVVTVVLVKGISESAGFNALVVFIKLFAVLFVILVGVLHQPEELDRTISPPTAMAGSACSASRS
ncbi:MAG: hypothetical protein U0736_19655 [Gemmataceae bacterium]